MAQQVGLFDGKLHDLGGGMVISRLLPQAKKRMVGPFVFFDHMGPFVAKAGQNIDVRPHPHIGLSTLTYLFEGRIVHRDSLGSEATIVPGEVNWMTAGTGIAHSERSHADDRNRDRQLHGLQFWVALPDAQEDCAPSFTHYSKVDIPNSEDQEKRLTVVAGVGFGLQSMVKTSSPLILAHLAAKNSNGRLPVHFAQFEIGVFVVAGNAICDGQEVLANQILVFDRGAKFDVEFGPQASFIILGGEPFPTRRHIWWNLVSSSKDKIEAAKKAWADGTFPMVPGETERILLP